MSLTTTREKAAFYVPPLRPGVTCDATASAAEVATVRVTDGEGRVLDFCGHHFEEHAAAMLVSGWSVARDNRVEAGK